MSNPPGGLVLSRLRAVSDVTSLAAASRLDAKVNLSRWAISQRLRTASAARGLCLWLGSAGGQREQHPRKG